MATGLAWTELGGELLAIEVTVMPGKGKLFITGRLGDVMQESAQAALSIAKRQRIVHSSRVPLAQPKRYCPRIAS